LLGRRSSNLSGVAEIDEFAFSPLPYLLYVSEITSAFIAHYDQTPFWISAGTNKGDLEITGLSLNARFNLKCALYGLRSRMSHGSDVRMFWLPEVAMRDG